MAGDLINILSFGSVNIDVAAHAERLPHPGETVAAQSHLISLGGKGANQAVAVARLGQACGLSVIMAGRIGNDPFGIIAREALTSFGVDTRGLVVDPREPTGLALITIDAHAENHITVSGGANKALALHTLSCYEPLLEKAEVLLLQMEIPVDVTIAMAEAAHQRNIRVILDPAPAPLNGLPNSLWKVIDIITPNEGETKALSGIDPVTLEDASHAARKLQSLGARHIVLKLGARGVFWRSGNDEGYIPAFDVGAIDTVAAGDCFNGGLAAALALKQNWQEALTFAAACGALATTQRGAAEAAPSWPAVQNLLASHARRLHDLNS